MFYETAREDDEEGQRQHLENIHLVKRRKSRQEGTGKGRVREVWCWARATFCVPVTSQRKYLMLWMRVSSKVVSYHGISKIRANSTTNSVTKLKQLCGRLS